MIVWLSLVLLAGHAAAEDAPVPPTEAPSVPEVEAPELPTVAVITRGERPLPWRMTLFQDLPGSVDCEPELALRGQCIEDVRFVAEPGGPEDDRALWRSVAAQEALLWEGMAYRWAVPDDLITTAIVANGYDTLPTPAASWEAARDRRGSVSAPDANALLPAARWVGAADTFFPLVRYKVGQKERTPAIAVLRGRFALRLGAKGRPHDYDVMDADPVNSSPFFEQMYPFASYDAAGMRRPLDEFDLPEFSGKVDPAQLTEATRRRVELIQLGDDDYAALSIRAAQRFENFVDLLSVQVAQFALDDFTPNQMRVFAALSAMVWPPERESKTAGGRRIVAAARGETDAAADIEARADRTSYVLRSGFLLQIEALDENLVSDWVDRFQWRKPLTVEELADLRAVFLREQGDNVRPDAPALTGPGREQMRAWASLAAGYGVDPELVVRDGQRYILSRFLARQGADERDENATRILFDQLRRSAASVFDDTPGARATPQDLVSSVSSQWGAQLAHHGFRPSPMAQPYGGVDPTAICTTVDGPAALGEPSYGAVNLDVLVRGRDRRPTDLGAAESLPDDVTAEVLWEARDQVPFLFVDAPWNRPEGTRIAGLPGDLAIYRIRWRVWTGWHLLWVDESLGEASRRLAVRTAAVCDDTVLADPTLVPTLVRAALLADTFRPTNPVPVKAGRQPDPKIVPPPAANVAYIREIALAPIQRLADSLGGFLLVAGDTDEGGVGIDLLPRTPYSRDSRSAGGKRVRSALWARFYAPAAKEEAPIVFPAWHPTQSVGSDSLYPLWSRVPLGDFTVTAGVGGFPWRQVDSRCGDDTGSDGFVVPCTPEEGVAETTHQEGFSADVAAMATFWALDRPRLGLEAGLEVRLDVSHSGASWVYPELPPSFTWMFRPAGGVILGLRGSPAPGPLWSGARGASLWGVDRLDGSSRLGRVEAGLRGGLLLAPGYSGTEGSLFTELWLGHSARRGRAPVANLTPYNPRANYGLFVRWMYATTLIPDGTPRRYELDSSNTLLVGLRGTWDLQLELPKAPEVK